MPITISSLRIARHKVRKITSVTNATCHIHVDAKHVTLLTLTHCQRHKANGSVSIFEFVFSKRVFVKFVLSKLVSSSHLMEGSGYMRTASVTTTALQEQVSRNGDSAMMRAPHDLFSNNSLGNDTVLSVFDLVDKT